jgi:hypothetical protein
MANVASPIINAVNQKLASVAAAGTQASAGTASTPDLNNTMFVFLLSWMLWLVLLSALKSTRVGYVLLYYSLLLMILYVLVTYFATLGPLLSGITNIGSVSVPSTTPTTPIVPIVPIVA